MAKRYTLLLNTGYAESAAVYFTPFRSHDTHKDAKAALLALAQWLKINYQARASSPNGTRECCMAAEADPENAFCSKCGRAVERERPFDASDAEGFRNYIVELCRCNTDDVGANEYLEEVFGDLGPDWEIGILEDVKNARIVFNAEEVLSAAIGHSSREDKTFEAICKARTKSKSGNFSFW